MTGAAPHGQARWQIAGHGAVGVAARRRGLDR
jgi:hypothetical protein